ncbi:hypothetical protein Tco_0751023 [Tanacetum coccineum]|uniref:Uncharacterized protein n=1 Tax=Tanacetum coccineum TaxID=301880 RepID=A0ABQ4Z3P0_9ASTR
MGRSGNDVPERYFIYHASFMRRTTQIVVEKMSDTEMGLDVTDTLCFQVSGARHRITWRRFILALGLYTEEEMVEVGFGAYLQGSEREDLLEKFIQKFYQISDDNEEIEAKKDDDPDDITDIFKIEGNLFDYKTPLCKAFNNFNYLLKIDKDQFTFDIQGIGTYEEYELNNPITMDLGELWLDNGVPYQLFDHICEPYRFKNGITKWPTYSSDIDGFCNGGELPGIVRDGNMTYFQDYKWYDELANGKLEDETLMHKARVKESWGNATLGVIKLCAWMIISFGNFHELDYNVLVKLQECWWKINAHEVAPFTRLESYGQRPYANFKTEKTHDPYLDINRIFDRSYDTSNAGNIQDNQGHEERRDDPAHKPAVCKIKRFKMMKYSFNAKKEYIAIK